MHAPDINECLMANDCQQKCENSVGSYRCSCNQEFVLNNDNRSCDGELPRQYTLMFIHSCQHVLEIVKKHNNYEYRSNFVVYLHIPIFSSALVVCPTYHGCSHSCAIVNHTEQYFCPSGYALQNITQCNGTQVEYVHVGICMHSYQWFLISHIYTLYYTYNRIDQSCIAFHIDIDECSMFSPCEQVCSNTVGSFKCLCRPGFVLQNDNTLCEGICTESDSHFVIRATLSIFRC